MIGAVETLLQQGCHRRHSAALGGLLGLSQQIGHDGFGCFCFEGFFHQSHIACRCVGLFGCIKGFLQFSDLPLQILERHEQGLFVACFVDRIGQGQCFDFTQSHGQHLRFGDQRRLFFGHKVLFQVCCVCQSQTCTHRFLCRVKDSALGNHVVRNQGGQRADDSLWHHTIDGNIRGSRCQQVESRLLGFFQCLTVVVCIFGCIGDRGEEVCRLHLGFGHAGRDQGVFAACDGGGFGFTGIAHLIGVQVQTHHGPFDVTVDHLAAEAGGRRQNR